MTGLYTVALACAPMAKAALAGPCPGSLRQERCRKALGIACFAAIGKMSGCDTTVFSALPSGVVGGYLDQADTPFNLQIAHA